MAQKARNSSAGWGNIAIKRYLHEAHRTLDTLPAGSVLEPGLVIFLCSLSLFYFRTCHNINCDLLLVFLLLFLFRSLILCTLGTGSLVMMLQDSANSWPAGTHSSLPVSSLRQAQEETWLILDILEQFLQFWSVNKNTVSIGLSLDKFRCDCRHRVFVHPLHSEQYILSHTDFCFQLPSLKVWSSMFYTNQLN